MKTKEYISKFDLQNPETETKGYDQKALLKALGEDFKESIEATVKQCIVQQRDFTLSRFQNEVYCINRKFWAISNKKIGRPFSDGLWKAFYALYIVPEKEKLYPGTTSLGKGVSDGE